MIKIATPYAPNPKLRIQDQAINQFYDSSELRENKFRRVLQEEVNPTSGKAFFKTLDVYFLHEVQRIVENHLSDPNFNVRTLSHEMCLSRVHLYRKIKAYTDQSPSEYIRNFRLLRAAALLKHRTGTISEVAYHTGFHDLSHFSKSFKNVFGVCPSAYQSYEVLRYEQEWI